MNGFAAGYEQTGDQDRLAATTNFFDIVTSAHSYATGGSNANEFWIAPRELAPTIYGVRNPQRSVVHAPRLHTLLGPRKPHFKLVDS